MKQVEPGTFEFTNDELRLKAEHDALLDAGYGPHDAVMKMLLAVPLDSTDWGLLNNQEFRDHLQTEGHACRPDALVFQGTMGAPGIGNVLKCPSCQIEWVQVGGIYYRADGTGMEDEQEPPWVLSMADVI